MLGLMHPFTDGALYCLDGWQRYIFGERGGRLLGQWVVKEVQHGGIHRHHHVIPQSRLRHRCGVRVSCCACCGRTVSHAGRHRVALSLHRGLVLQAKHF